MHTEVLGWDLYQVLNDDSMYSLRKVPVHFDSVDEYLDVMEPLLILFGYLVMFIVIVAAFGWRLTPGMG